MSKLILIAVSLCLVAANLLFGSIESSVFLWLEMSYEQKELLKMVLFENRIPRTMLAFLSGSSCALAGLVLQTIFKNPLAGPTTLGVNSGASLGIVLYYFCVSSLGFIPMIAGNHFFAVTGSLLFLFFIIALSLRFKSVTTVLIVGMLMGYVAYSMIEVVIQSSSDVAISNYVFWGMGSFNSSSWSNVMAVGLSFVLASFFFLRNAKKLNLYLLGDLEMMMAGLNVKRMRIEMMLVSGVLIGVLTSIVGPLAFLGIAVPNLLKILLKTLNHEVLILFCILVGGAFAVLADLLSRGAVFEAVFPLNAVLSIIAVPVIMTLFFRKRNEVSP